MGAIEEFLHNYPNISKLIVAVLFVVIPIMILCLYHLGENLSDWVREVKERHKQVTEEMFLEKLDKKQKALFCAYEDGLLQFGLDSKMREWLYGRRDRIALREALDVVEALTCQAKDRLLELNEMIDMMRSLQDWSSDVALHLDDAESRLGDMEDRMREMKELRGKINVMTAFFDMMDKDGFWDPIKNECGYEATEQNRQR